MNIQNVAQPKFLPSFITFPTLQKETSYPLSSYYTLTLPPTPCNHQSTLCIYLFYTLLSLGMLLKSIHVVACMSTLFFLCGWILHCMHISQFVIHSSDDGHLGFFHFFALMNTAINTHIHTFIWVALFNYFGGYT